MSTLSNRGGSSGEEDQENMRQKSLPITVLVVALGSMLSSRLSAQTFKTLHSFTGCSSVTNNGDGCGPLAALILSSNTLYGTTLGGGSSGYGTVFKIYTDGTGFRTLHSFTGGSDGKYPRAPLILSSNTLYGAARAGGSSGTYGTVFAVNTDGGGFTNLYSFTGGGDGFAPDGGLVLIGNTLYGTASGGGLGNGTVFSLNTDGSGFTVLYSFSGNDGDAPHASLILSGNILYGTTAHGGSWDSGTVFKLNTDGSGFTTLYSFTATDPNTPTNNDGSIPFGLILSGNTLYGNARGGGSFQNGTLFKVNTDGTGFTTLHSFTAGMDNGAGRWTNSDGGDPNGLILSGSTLFGTAGWGGSTGRGTVFSLNTNGTAFSVLHTFRFASDGGQPLAALIQSGDTFYGTSYDSATFSGTVFSISLPASQPQLTITPAGGNVILSWPTNFTGVTLQSTTNLAIPAWDTNLPAPVVANGQFTVTNPITGTRQFFRLSE